MSSKFLAAAIIVGLCVAAAGGGAYLAVRQNAQAAPQADPDVRAAAAPLGATGATEVPATAAAPAEASPVTGTDTVSRAPAPRPAPARPSVTRERRRPTATLPATGAPNAAQAVAEPASAVAEATPVAEDPPVQTQTPSPYIPSRPTMEQPVAEPVAQPEVAESAPAFEEVLVPADAVIGVQIDRTISSDFARVEDRVDGRVTRDVRVAGQVAIPAGSKVRGTVTFTEQGGKFKTRARLGVRFHTILLADGASIPIQTETIFREGESPAGDARAKIGGGAVGGAIIGAILGGRKGAAIGGSLGAGAGTAAVAAGDTNAATLPAGSTVTVRLNRPATITIEKHEQ